MGVLFELILPACCMELSLLRLGEGKGCGLAREFPLFLFEEMGKQKVF